MNPLENAFYAGLGLALRSKEVIEDAAKKIAEENHMNAEEGRKFVEHMMASAESTKDDMARRLDEAVRFTASRMGFAEQSEVDALKSRVAGLEAQLRSVDGK